MQSQTFAVFFCLQLIYLSFLPALQRMNQKGQSTGSFWWAGMNRQTGIHLVLDVSIRMRRFHDVCVSLLQKHSFILMYEERFVDVASYVCRILDQIPASPVSPMYVDWCPGGRGRVAWGSLWVQWLVGTLSFGMLVQHCLLRGGEGGGPQKPQNILSQKNLRTLRSLSKMQRLLLPDRKRNM